jgi:hypothetical protein
MVTSSSNKVCKFGILQLLLCHQYIPYSGKNLLSLCLHVCCRWKNPWCSHMGIWETLTFFHWIGPVVLEDIETHPDSCRRTTNCQQWRCVQSVCVIHTWYISGSCYEATCRSRWGSPPDPNSETTAFKGLPFLGENLKHFRTGRKYTGFPEMNGGNHSGVV